MRRFFSQNFTFYHKFGILNINKKFKEGGIYMLLSQKTTIKLNNAESNIIGHMCYAAYKLWNVLVTMSDRITKAYHCQ